MDTPAIAICGSHLSDAQVALLRDGSFKKVVMWLDNDIAGSIEEKRLRALLIENGIQAEFVNAETYPEINSGKDVGELDYSAIEAVLDAAGV